MKKLLIIFICFLLLTGCNNNKYNLDKEYYNNTSLKDITKEELINLEKDKSSFAVFLYQPSCTVSTNLNNIIETFIEENDITIYKYSFSNIEDTKMEEVIKHYPTVVLYKKGKIHTFLDANCNEDLSCYQNINDFNNWFTNNIKMNTT